MNGKHFAMIISIISLLFILFVQPDIPGFFIILIINQIAFVLIGALYDQTKQKAEIDYLTKLHNRRFIFEKIPKILKKTKHVSVCMIDIDNFKEINDLYGHFTGDEVIKRVATLLRSETRRNDLVVRWGGDEFLIFAPNITEKFLDSLSERIDFQLKELSYVYGFDISISMGIAACDCSGNIQTTIDRADKNMYERKKTKKLAHEYP